MSYLNSAEYRNCEAAGRTVDIRRAEGQCRSENRCEQVECPLAGEFAGRLLVPGSRLITGAIGLGWLAGRFNG